MTLGRWTALACLVAACVALARACGDASPARKNVILITLDTTRADFLSCYGYPEPTTPHLDRLAAQGTRFDMAISTAGVTPVSHASILTGLDNQEHKLRVLSADGGFRLPDDVPTLATELAKRGYHTVAVHSALPVSRHFGFQRGFEVFEDLDGEIRTAGPKHQWDVGTYQRRSDETTELVEAKLGEEPFFLWIHYWDPHDWLKLPPEELMPAENRNAQGQPIRPNKPLYAAEIRYVDQQIGRLFAWLEERDLYDDTLVVVTADHGQGLFEHGWPAHRLLYQEQVHVPLIVRLPGVEQPKSVRDLVRTTDVFPTVLDYLGFEPPRPVSGRSLRPLLEGRPDQRRIAFGDQINGYDRNAGMTGKRPFDHFLYMAFDWPWKLIYRPLTPEKSLLYQVERDPDEEHDLYASEPGVRVRLLKELAKARPWVIGDFEPIAGATSAAVEHGLDDLGYVGGQTVDPTWIWICPEHQGERVKDIASRCPVCKGPPIVAVDPACVWACPDHPEQVFQGPDGRCAVAGCTKEPEIRKP
jgi:arylsulfatase A-like enzyme